MKNDIKPKDKARENEDRDRYIPPKVYFLY